MKIIKKYIKEINDLEEKENHIIDLFKYKKYL